MTDSYTVHTQMVQQVAVIDGPMYILINVALYIVTEPNCYGNVCSMYCIVAIMQYT